MSSISHCCIWRSSAWWSALGQQFAQGGDAGAAVGLADDRVGVEAVDAGEAGPAAGDGGGGVDKHAVEVEEEGLAADRGRSPGVVGGGSVIG